MSNIVTQEQYEMAQQVELLVRRYGVPRNKLLALIRMGFEAGNKHGLTMFAEKEIGKAAVQR